MEIVIAPPEDGYLPDDEADETSFERMVGLTEMLPNSVREKAGKGVQLTIKGVKKLYGLSRTWTWIVFASSSILFAPVLFQLELHQMEEMAKMQQRQMLLGPSAAAQASQPGALNR